MKVTIFPREHDPLGGRAKSLDADACYLISTRPLDTIQLLDRKEGQPAKALYVNVEAVLYVLVEREAPRG